MRTLPECLWKMGLLAVILCVSAMAPAHSEPDMQAKYQQAVSEIERLKAALEMAQDEIRKLRRQLQRSTSSPPSHAAPNDLSSEDHADQNVLAALSREIETHPGNARAYAKRGAVQLKLKAYPQAMQDFDAAIAKGFPDTAVLYNQRGLAQFQLGHLQASINDFTRAVEHNPALAEAYNNRGIAHRTTGDYVRAIQDLRQAMNLGLKSVSADLQVLQDEVRQMQQQLQLARLQPDPADGIPGSKTIAALRTFQQREGLPVTGRLDDATKQRLGTRPVSPSSEPETQSDLLSHFVHRPTPVYPLSARQQGMEGTVTLRVEMLADGTVGQINVLESAGHPILDEAAQNTVKQWTHNLLRQQDTREKRWGTLSFTFTLDKKDQLNTP
ncbi:MAG: TonB family protein [Candidatus Tectomicrobia bacterium]|nr:TonB family protein [Candidatus Tectomicrobia bacterium]